MRYGFLYRNRWFIAVVGLPTLLAIFYYGLIASDQYVSDSRFIVKNRSEKSSAMPSIASLIQTTGLSAGQEQTNEVMDYIQSRNALSDLQTKFNIKAAYANRAADILTRYPTIGHEDRFENLFRYYSGMIDARIDTKTNLAILEVRAFTPADAHNINAILLDLSENLVNRLNVKANQNAITEAERHVTLAEDRVRHARLTLARYRSQEDLLDPTKQAESVLEISNRLQAQQASLQAQLSVMERLTPSNPSIASLRQQITAIDDQVSAQNGKAIGNKGGISSKVANYENLQLEQEFGSQALLAARTSLEEAETQAVQQQFYLERIVEPNTPDLAELPRRLSRIATVFAVSVCLYLIGWMLVVGILEHAPED
jgi:capsular polysaccharide transport system permease protein